jgi:hypothetical protein
MATKKGSSKKSSTKKSASKKSSKKSAKKATVKSGITATPGVTFPPPNLRCILACVTQYNSCLKKGVNPALCQKRLQRCIMKCAGGGIFDEGGDVE